MKLIKYSLIAAVGGFLLPAPPPESYAVMQNGARINLETGQVLCAAASTFSDVSGFCKRQPTVCDIAQNMFSSLEVRAKYNFRRLYEWSSSSDGPKSPMQFPSLGITIEQSANVDPVVTGSIQTSNVKSVTHMVMAQSVRQPSVNTLTIEDIVPEWRGPVQTSTG